MDKKTIYYGKNGISVDETNAFAQHTVTDDLNFYFILCFNGMYHDPYNSMTLRKTDLNRTRWQKVDKSTFDNYFKFLKTKNEKYLTLSRRGI